ncbi:MAG: CRTAC1 family protein [Sedimentisphaerales bacterium]
MIISAPGCESKCFLRNPAALGLACFCFLLTDCVSASIQLRDVTKQTGISFVHTDGSSGKRYIVETVSAGLALFDYDEDGDIDIYFLNGAPLHGTTVKVPPQNALYRNDGGWKFTDVTEKAGAGDLGYGLGVAVGDYDNDGDPDIYLNNYGPNVLYSNNGDGTFTDVTEKANVSNGHQVGAGACFLDIDKDGDLDLYVANYVNFTYENHQIVRFNGYPAYVGPMNYYPTPDTLYRNNGDGTFTDISEESGIAAHKGTGMGMVCADYDNDGDTDIYVGNDVAGNFIFENDGTGKFEEVGLFTGLAYDLSGTAQGTMGIDCGDYNNDCLLDFHVTSYQRDLATLYRNLGGGSFEDVTRITGAGDGTLPHVTWGNGLVDFDNDGDRDIFIACGHLHDNIEFFDNVTSYHVQNILLENTDREKFVNISDKCGDGLAVKLSSRGAGFDDLDNDGDIDAVILNSRREPTILRNDSANNNHWIQIRLKGVKTNRDGIGAHVKVTAGDLTFLDEVHSGRGYQGHYGMRLHFGLGNRQKINRIEVSWIGGETDVFENVAVNQLIILTEGSSKSGSD